MGYRLTWKVGLWPYLWRIVLIDQCGKIHLNCGWKHSLGWDPELYKTEKMSEYSLLSIPDCGCDAASCIRLLPLWYLHHDGLWAKLYSLNCITATGKNQNTQRGTHLESRAHEGLIISNYRISRNGRLWNNRNYQHIQRITLEFTSVTPIRKTEVMASEVSLRRYAHISEK